jgi:hypothetical protein
MVTFPDAIYVASGLKCDVLDPMSGDLIKSLDLNIESPENKTPGVVAIRATDDFR